MLPTGYPELFVNDARKFDSGGKPNPILLPMLRVAMEKVTKLDLGKEHQRLKELMEPLLMWAQQNGYYLPSTPHAYHLVGIRHPNATEDKVTAILQELKKRGIVIAVRVGGFRISPYTNTTPEDIQHLIEALSSLD